MDTIELASNLAMLRDRASDAQWETICETFQHAKQDESYEQLISRLPAAVNSDALYLLRCCIANLKSRLDPAAFAVFLETAGHIHQDAASESRAEIVWTGPATPSLAVRRTDQVLYDLISQAKDDILLITFAAAYVDRLRIALRDAGGRGVKIRLLLEFKEESQGQLSVDALDAFEGLEDVAQIYTWPLAQRGINQAGKPGKLHAKCALVDHSALMSSANLTDDAFNRNMEVGLLFRAGPVPQRLRQHFDVLIADGILARWHSPQPRTAAPSPKSH